MKKWFWILIFCSLFSGIKAQTNGLEYAKGLFVEGNFRESGKKLFDYLQSSDTKDTEAYALAVLSLLQTNERDRAAEVISMSMKRGVDANQVFTQMRQSSKSSGMPGVFEKISLLLEHKEGSCVEISGRQLLQYYLDNRRFEKATLVLEELLRLNPGNTQNLSILASVHQSLGNDSQAVETYQKLIGLDTLNFDANVFIGNYYFLLGQNALVRLRNQNEIADNMNKLNIARYQMQRQEIISRYIAKSIIYLKNANKVKTTSQLRKNIEQEDKWLKEL